MNSILPRWVGLLTCLGLGVTAKAEWKPPAGFFVPPATVSQDGRYGVTVPDEDHVKEGTPQNQIVELATGKVLGTIEADTYAVWKEGGGTNSMTGYGLGAAWSEDGSTLSWAPQGEWCPAAFVLIKIEDAKIAWQADVLKKIQDAMLAGTKEAAPKNYPAAVKMNEGNGSAYPDGFTIVPSTPETGFALPWHCACTIDSNPKGIERLPAKGNIGASADLEIAANGDVTLQAFKIAPELTGVARAEGAGASELLPPSMQETAKAAPAADSTADPDNTAIRIPNFVTNFVRLDTSINSADAVECYLPDSVTYFDDADVDSAFIRKDKAAYAAKWPSRSEDLTGEVGIEPIDAYSWTVTYPTHFTLIARDRSWMEGNAAYTLTILHEGNDLFISKQSVKISDTKKGKALGAAFHVPKEHPVVTCEFPKPWTADYDEDGVGLTGTLGEDVVIYVQPIDATDVTGQLAEAQKSLQKEGVKFDQQPDAESTGAINGIDVATTLWKGRYEDGDTEVQRHVLTIPATDPDKAVDTSILVTVWGAPEDIEKNRTSIDRILHHITLYKGK